MSRIRWLKPLIYLVSIIFILAIPSFIKGLYHQHILIMVGLNIILAGSLALITKTGQISFAHPGFMAIGAYTSTLLVTMGHINYLLTLPVATLTAGIIALIIGYPLLRIKGAYFFLATFAFLEFLRLIFTFFRYPFGGSKGISRIPSPSVNILGLPKIDFVVGGIQYYYLIVFLTAVTLLILYRIERSRYDRIFKSIAQNDTLAESLGINIMKYKLFSFVIGSCFAGMAGAFYAPFFTFISPHVFNLILSIFILIYVVVGGIGSITGGVVGAAALTIIPESLRATGHYEMIIFAIILILVVMFLPGGLVSLPTRISSWFTNLRLLVK